MTLDNARIQETGSAAADCRVLVGLPVHPESLPFLAPNLAYWRQEAPCFARVVVVANGAWPSPLLQRLRELVGEYSSVELLEELCGRCRPGAWENLCAAQELLWELTLSGGSTHLLLHEITRLPPPGALGLLLDCRVPVAGAVYRDSHIPGGYSVMDFAGGPDIHSRPHTLITWNRQPVRVGAVCFGFTLLRRDVLTRLKPRCGKYAADHYFCRDAFAAGVPVFAAPVLVRNVRVDSRPLVLLGWWLAYLARIVRDLLRYRSRFLEVAMGRVGGNGETP